MQGKTLTDANSVGVLFLKDTFSTGQVTLSGRIWRRFFIYMIKTAFAALALTAVGVAMAPAAQAEPQFYVNPEFNQGWVKSTNAGGVLDMHIGLEDGPFYIQAGPSMATGLGDTTWGVTGKTGVSGKVSDQMNLYAEVSAGKFNGGDVAYGLKVGSKFRF